MGGDAGSRHPADAGQGFPIHAPAPQASLEAVMHRRSSCPSPLNAPNHTRPPPISLHAPLTRSGRRDCTEAEGRAARASLAVGLARNLMPVWRRSDAWRADCGATAVAHVVVASMLDVMKSVGSGTKSRQKPPRAQYPRPPHTVHKRQPPVSCFRPKRAVPHGGRRRRSQPGAVP